MITPGEARAITKARSVYGSVNSGKKKQEAGSRKRELRGMRD
jgi:hypothetical protein